MLQYMNKNKRFDMPQNSPENYTWITYLWVVGLSILGGTVRTLTHLKLGMSFRDLCRRWFLDIIVSVFVGFVTFFLCQYAQLDMNLTIAFVSISAHMGTRAIVIIEELVYKKIMGKENKDGN